MPVEIQPRRTILSGMRLALMGLLLFTQNEAEEKKAAEERIAKFKEGYKAAQTDEERIEELKTLAQMRHRLIAKELVKYAAQGSDAVRAAAMQLLGEKFRKDKDAAEGLLAAISKQANKEMKIKTIRALGAVAYRPLAASLHPYFNNKDNDLAAAALDACGKIGSKNSIDPIIALLKQLDKIEVGLIKTADNPKILEEPKKELLERKEKLSGACIGALREITGETHTTGVAWEKWWGTARAKFKERED